MEEATAKKCHNCPLYWERLFFPRYNSNVAEKLRTLRAIRIESAASEKHKRGRSN